MNIKISHPNKEIFEQTLINILNISSVIASAGNLPTDYDISNLNRGNYWILEDDSYNLYPTTNDYKAFIREKCENSITLEFHYRYDKLSRFNELITQLINYRFRFETEIID